MEICKLIDLQSKIDERGKLVILEEEKNIPFKTKRIFYMYDVKDDKSRGNHANIYSNFLMIAMQGSVDVNVDNIKTQEKIILNDATKGLYIPCKTWKRMENFSPDCILMVIADTLYTKEDYINDYDEYKRYMTTK